MNERPLRSMPSIRFVDVEIVEGPIRDGYHVVPGLLNLVAAVPDRFKTEREIEIRFACGLPPHWKHMPGPDRGHWLRSQMIEFVTHEIDEMLFVSALGPDPHRLPTY